MAACPPDELGPAGTAMDMYRVSSFLLEALGRLDAEFSVDGFQGTFRADDSRARPELSRPLVRYRAVDVYTYLGFFAAIRLLHRCA